MKRHSGFTLIELVIVIVILGLLAATALPRFINLSTDARRASVNGVAGGVSAAASLARAQVMVSGSGGGTISMDGVSVAVNASGYPTGGITGGIVSAVQGVQGYTIGGTAPNTTFQPTGGSSSCQASYDANSGAVTASTSGC